MATRSRSIRSSPWLRLVATLLSIAGILLMAYGTLAAEHFELAFQSSDYDLSDTKRQTLFHIENVVRQISQEYRSEEFIISGGTAEPVLNSQNSLPSRLEREMEELESNYDWMIDNALDAGDLAAVERLKTERNRLLSEKQIELERTRQESREQLIAMDLTVYRSLRTTLAEPNAYLYHVPIKGGGTLSNVGAESDIPSFFRGLQAATEIQLPDEQRAYIGLTSEQYTALLQEYLSDRQAGTLALYRFLGGALLFLLGLGYVMNTAGVHIDSDQVALGPLDHIYLDVALAVLVTLGGLCISGMVGLWEQYQTAMSQAALVLGAALSALLALTALLAGDMLSKRIKRRDALRHTLIHAAIAWTWRLLRRIWSGSISKLIQAGPVSIRLLGLLLAYNLTVILAFTVLVDSYSTIETLFGLALFLGANALILFYLLRKVTALRLISDGAKRVGEGEPSHRIPLDTNAELAELARRVNQIAAGLKAAVDREVKAERMKAELVTNVSHDLKTPLTSIITYVDLLKTEGLTSEQAPKYLDVLDQKSQRLKNLTEDLFEAAKAASGNIALHLERLDVSSLISQGVAELAEKIDASGLDFRVTLPPERLYVQADGRLLWRVVENLLQNILKYALPGSRVYAEAAAHNEQVSIILKNISAAPLNVDPEELLERFKRGDESRHSEGSGLGLSIAKSLTELQGGTFQVHVDGDLFKATVTLPRSN